MRRNITFEGYSPGELLEIPDNDIDSFVFIDEPLVFKAGSAEILGEFRIEANSLIIELAQIDGGGEGILPTLWILSEKIARKRNLDSVEWIVHALTCAKPNLKLRRILELKGFEVKDVGGNTEAYYYKNDFAQHSAVKDRRDHAAPKH